MPLLGAVLTAGFVGATLTASPQLALAIVLLVVAIATLPTRVWLTLLWIVLGGLTILTFGFNNIPLPMGTATVPLVDVLLLYILVASYPYWKPLLATTLGRRLLAALVTLTIVGTLRVILDWPTHGVLAVRDSLYVFEAWAVLVGFAFAQKAPSMDIHRGLTVIFSLVVTWSLLRPFQEVLTGLGPTVGVQRPVPLLSWTTGPWLVLAVVWLMRHAKRAAVLPATLGIIGVLFAQLRTAYVLLPLALGIALLLDRVRSTEVRPSAGRHVTVLVAVTGLGIILLLALPTVEGRVGAEVGLATAQEQVGTLTGAEGVGAGSFRHRLRTWPEVIDTVRDEPLGWLIGVGYGPDLFGGHKTGSVLTRTPHNEYLEIWARTGLIGFIPWIALVWILVSHAIRSHSVHPWGGWLPVLHLVVLCVAFVQPLFSFAYGGLVYFLLAGLGIGLICRPGRDPSTAERTHS